MRHYMDKEFRFPSTGLAPSKANQTTENKAYLRIAGGRHLGGSAVEIEPELLHFVLVALLFVAADAQVKVLADRAVVARLHALAAAVAVVHKLVLALSKISCRDLYKM